MPILYIDNDQRNDKLCGKQVLSWPIYEIFVQIIATEGINEWLN